MKIYQSIISIAMTGILATGVLSAYADSSPSTSTLLPLTSTLWVSVEGVGEGKVITQENKINCTKAGGEKCQATYHTGTPVTLIPIAAPGSSFSSWGGNEDCVDNQVQMFGSLPCRAFFSKLVELRISKAGTGEGTVTGKGINCGMECTSSYPPNTQVTLIPKAASGSYFSHWEGHQDCLDGQVLISESKSCVAYFQSFLELRVKIVGKGSVKGGDIDCSQDCIKAYPLHTQVTLIAVPMQNYHFQNWGEACAGTSPIFTMNVDEIKTCVAHFDIESHDDLLPERDGKHPDDEKVSVLSESTPTLSQLNEMETLFVSSNHKDVLEQTDLESLNKSGEKLLVTVQTAVQDYQNVTQTALNEERVEALENFESQIKPLRDQATTIAMLAQNIVERLQNGEMFLNQALVNNMTDEELAGVLGETGLKAHVEAGLISPIRAQTISQLGLPAFNQNFLDFGSSCSSPLSPTSYLDSILDVFVPKAEASAILGCLSICRASFNQTCLNCIISKGATVVNEVKNLIAEWNKCSGWFKWACRAVVAAKILWVIA